MIDEIFIKEKNVVNCTVCGFGAHLLKNGMYCCSVNHNHWGSTTTGDFTDLTYPPSKLVKKFLSTLELHGEKEQKNLLPQPRSSWGKMIREKLDKLKGKA